MQWVKQDRTKDTITLDFRADYKPLLPLDAAISAVYDIAATYDPPYNLFASGGVDSQAMIYAWLRSGVKFNVVSIKYDNQNRHDLKTLFEFGVEHGIKINFINFDLYHFLDTEFDSYARKYECSSPQICTYMKFSELVTGTSIYSGNFIQPNITKEIIPLTWPVLGLERFSKGKPIVPFFFLHTPELARSFLFKKQTIDRDPYLVKCQLYQEFGFPVIPQLEKYTGFEIIKGEIDNRTDLITNFDRLKYVNKPSKRIFDIKYRYPYEDLYPNLKVVGLV